jgi:hypothetical protein
VRIEPAVKEGLKKMAEQERRSIANLIEIMIRDYCGRNGIAIPEQGSPFGEGQKPTWRGEWGWGSRTRHE